MSFVFFSLVLIIIYCHSLYECQNKLLTRTNCPVMQCVCETWSLIMANGI